MDPSGSPQSSAIQSSTVPSHKLATIAQRIFQACQQRNIHIVRTGLDVLISMNGVSVLHTIKSPSGNGALMYAAKSGDFDIAHLLLSRGQVDAKEVNINLDTALMFCCSGDDNICDELAKDDISSTSTNSSTTSTINVNHNDSIENRNENNRLCLLKLLIDNGCPVTTFNAVGMTSIMCCVSAQRYLLLSHCINSLTSSSQLESSSLTTFLCLQNSRGDNALHIACRKNDIKSLKLLLSLIPNGEWYCRNNINRSPIDECVIDTECYNLLVADRNRVAALTKSMDADLFTLFKQPIKTKQNKNNKNNNKLITNKITNSLQASTSKETTEDDNSCVKDSVHNSSSLRPSSPVVNSGERAYDEDDDSWIPVTTATSKHNRIPAAMKLRPDTPSTSNIKNNVETIQNFLSNSSEEAAIGELQIQSKALQRLSPVALDLDLKRCHLFGIGLQSMSMSQLDALEHIYLRLLSSVSDSKVALARRQEQERLEEPV